MDCQARHDQILLYALDDLSGPDRDELRAHLQTGCPYCQGQLAEAGAILELLPWSLPRAAVPATARRRLLERIGSPMPAQIPLSAKATSSAALFSPARRSFHWLAAGLAGGAVAAGITVLIYAILLSQTKKSLDISRKIANNRETELMQLRQQVRMAQERLSRARHSGVQTMSLSGQGAQPLARADLIWEPSHKMLIFHAEDLKTLQPGRAYELWLVNSGNKAIPAGMFTADALGHGSLVEELKMDPGKVMASAVSEEPAQGVMNPTTGNILLMSRAD